MIAGGFGAVNGAIDGVATLATEGSFNHSVLSERIIYDVGSFGVAGINAKFDNFADETVADLFPGEVA